MMKQENCMQRINVVGTSASGKSTFARALAEKLGLAYIVKSL